MGKSMPERYLQKLKRFYRDHRRMPSYGELALLLGFKSKNAAQYLVAKWLTAGTLAKDAAGKLLPGRMFSPVMMLGTVGASFPSPAEEEEADTISLDEWLIDNKESSFLLKISGESMIDAGIHPGDVVILQRGRKAKTGDIVVAEIDGEWTIKYYEQRGKRVRLIPANKGDASYKPIEPNDEMRIAGVVSAVVRKYA